MAPKENHQSTPRGQWFKSSYSGSHGECVEVADLTGRIGMRDTQNRGLGALFFNADEWQAFLTPTQNSMR